MTPVAPSPARASIVDNIYAYLRDAILSGDLKDGEQLRQLEIADRMGCSQGPVRHALDRLSSEELVLLLPNRGYFVAQISLDQARQAYQLRELMEPFAAVETLRRLGAPHLREFDRQFERMQASNRRSDFKASLAADMKFHRMFYEHSGFPLLLKFWEAIETQTRKFVTVTTPVYVADLPHVTELHVPILDALHRGDAEGLALATREHIRHVWDLVGAAAPEAAAESKDVPRQPGRPASRSAP